MKNTKQILKNVFNKAIEILSDATRELIPYAFSMVSIVYFSKLIVTEQISKLGWAVTFASFSVSSLFLNQSVLRMRLDALFDAFKKSHELEMVICEHVSLLNSRLEKLEGLVEDLQNNAD